LAIEFSLKFEVLPWAFTTTVNAAPPAVAGQETSGFRMKKYPPWLILKASPNSISSSSTHGYTPTAAACH
jgi:hypothetical protein